ncbi:MAG TPA: efflux RND transporter periplasmic adaptor subunit [Armatimonadota bacterium]
MRTVSMTLLAFAIVAVVLLSGCKGKQPAVDTAKTTVEKPTVPVSVVQVQRQTLDERVEVTGTLQPANEVTVGPHLAGRLEWVIGKSGTRVKRGQVVARLDDGDASIQLRVARSSVRTAEARLAQTKAAYLQQQASTNSGILTAEAGVAAAQARLQQSKTSRDALAATTNAQIQQAQQALNAATSRYSMTKNGSRSQEKMIADNNARLAEATLKLDKRNYQRYQELYTQGAVAKSTLDAAETKVQVSQAQYDSAMQQSSLVKEGARQEDIDTAKAAMEQAQASLDAAKAGLQQVEVAKDNVAIAVTGVAQAKAALASAQAAMNIDVMRDKDVLAAQAALQQAQDGVASGEQALDYTRIYSPVDGVIAERMAEVGQSLGANVGVFRISTENMLYFEAEVSELEATRMRAGQPVYLTVDAMQGNRANIYRSAQAQALVGTIERVVPVVDAKTRNFTVRVVVVNSPALYPGMFARGQVMVARHNMATVVPKDAVIDQQGEQVVFVVVNGAAKKRVMTLGATDGAFIQVLSGVTPGEQVVLSGQQGLMDGDAVSIKASSTTAPPPAS